MKNFGPIVIPVVIRTTENMLQLIPAGLREAAYALGTPKWKVILSITLRAARAGDIRANDVDIDGVTATGSLTVTAINGDTHMQQVIASRATHFSVCNNWKKIM